MKRAFVALVTLGFVAVPSVALAQQQGPRVYVGVLPTTTTVQDPGTTTTTAPESTTTLSEQVLGQVETPPTQPAVAGSTLPVTGGDVLGMTAIGAGLVAIGAGLARARRRANEG